MLIIFVSYGCHGDIRPAEANNAWFWPDIQSKVTIVTYFYRVKRAKLLTMRDKAAEKAVSRLIDEFARVRAERQVSHETLAKAAGVHRSTISLIESKKRIPTILTCLKIANALDLDLGQVLVDLGKK